MTYDIGFIGYGLMGTAHANALARLPMFFPDAPASNRHIIAGRDEPALEAAADRYGFDRTTTDWREAVADADVVYNLTPNTLHPEPSIEALETDTHVLCEKPLAATLEGADRMVAAAETTDAVAGCAFNYRYVPALVAIRNLVADGVIGDIRHFRGQYLQDFQADPEDPWIWRNDADVAGYGTVGDVGAHTLDLARWLVGDIDRVAGTLTRFADERPVPETGDRSPVTTDDSYGALLEFANGAQGVLEGSRMATGHKNTNAIELIGSKGAVRYDVERFNEFELQREHDRGFQRISATESSDPYMDAWWPAGHGIGWEHTFVHENYEFLSAIDEGSSYAPDFADAYAVQEVVDAIVESDRSGTWVTVP
ncbi:Gfo/Idh/MocA family protein [Natrinema ejinorense]|uniref:Oxidoreductase n=1 Tax=Natrinema ejinorense TaxID=373386 RepID=A0A2A5QPQ8_9EURY|nr:Gfo/Idh/MocA family oxidoreductase [Natrinema ejinorense]PCR88836.1 oxidoreductase [Natrinema ejinorense]